MRWAAAVLVIAAALSALLQTTTLAMRGFAVTDPARLDLPLNRFQGGPFPDPSLTPERWKVDCTACPTVQVISVDFVSHGPWLAVGRALGLISLEEHIRRVVACDRPQEWIRTWNAQTIGAADAIYVEIDWQTAPPAYSADVYVILGGDILRLAVISDDRAITLRNLALVREIILPQVIGGH
ncbi:MAG: hypothetical protein AAGB15_00375 [Pseudomonadota bacterium]